MAYTAAALRRQSLNQCMACEADLGAPPHNLRCGECAAKMTARNRVRRANYALAGNCPCGRKLLSPTDKTCPACRSYNRGTPEEKRAEYSARRTAGLCTVCRKPRIGESTRCLEHYLQGVARGAHRDRVKWEDLLSIYNSQGGRCYYTGIPLVFGRKNSEESAHIDHKKPKSRFPELAWEPSNLVFSSGKINMWKGFKTDDEFIALCATVAKHRGGLKA